MVHDLRYALRVLRRHPGFTGVAVLTLALGIGANAAVFSVVDAVLLRPLPYPEPERVYRLTAVPFRFLPTGMALSRTVEQNQVFSGIGLYAPGGLNLDGAPAERVRAAAVSPGFFAALGAVPVVGRTFTADDAAASPYVAVISHGLWVRRFGADRAVPGRHLPLNGRPYTVTGVLPPRVAFPGATDVWIPAGSDRQITGAAFAPDVIARFAPGVTAAHALAEIDAINERAARGDAERRGPAATARPLRDELVGGVRPTVLVVAAAVALVLLVACINAANLLLARVAAREREFAVRRALGASAGTLARQLLCESAVLALLGALAAVPAAMITLGAVRVLVPPTMHGAAEVAMNLRTLAALFAIAATTAVLFGLAPSLSVRGRSPADALRASPGASADPFWRRFRSSLVVGEVAIALVLLASAAAVIQTVARLTAVDLGASGERALAFELTLPQAKYGTAELRVQVFDALAARLAAVPGVEQVGATSMMPGSREVGVGMPARIADTPEPGPGDRTPGFLVASPGYFEAAGVALVAGRAFTAADRAAAPGVAIVNEHMAVAAGLPPAALVGRTVRVGLRQPQELTIVGVVRRVRIRGPETEVGGQLYRPFAQWPTFASTYMVVKATDDPRTLVPAIRAAVAAVDPGLPLYNIRTFDEIRHTYLADRRFAMTLLLGFGALALVLALVGLYGVISYLVQLRTREIGIRMALGASARRVGLAVVASGLIHAAAGIAVGTLATLALARTLRAGIAGLDGVPPLAFGAIAATMLVVAALSTWVPARRATRTDPVRALTAD